MNNSLHSQIQCKTRNTMRILRSVSVAMILLSSSLGFAQVNCNVVMACNDHVQVSLGDLCTQVITPGMIVENQSEANSEYNVVVTTLNGVVVPGSIMTSAHIGQTFYASVTLTQCGLSCWGTFNIEDKKPPVFATCPDATINCSDPTTPGGVVPRPLASDNCSTVTLKSSDIETVYPCANLYGKKIVRSWTATDKYGNISNCVQTIFVRRASISDVKFPADKIAECGPGIPRLPNGAPHPDYSGYPTGATCANMQYYYTDLVFPLCGAGIKVLRQWVVIDWCSGRDTTGNQTIKVMDTQPPVCTTVPDFSFKIGTDAMSCTGSFDVPPPVVVFECSGYDYIVGYKLKDASGNPFLYPVYDNVTKLFKPDGSYYYRITGLPKDTSWIVYTITDQCGHSTMCFTEVIVTDDDPPSAICEGHTVVSLGTDGWADVFATSINSGSEDNCGVTKFEVKRLTNTCNKPGDLNFSPKVNFCCDDSNPDPNFYVKVVLRVYDAAGNYNDCVANVKVQDKKPPTIMCPPNITINCTQNYKNSALTGRPTFSDNCTVRIDSTDSPSLNVCGRGTVNRVWKATDKQGLSASCTQVITLGDQNPFTSANITFPPDLTLNGCTKADADPDITGSLPIYTNTDCADIAVSYDDDIFTVPGACLKILRTWRLIDWCNANQQNPVFITYVQKIILNNSVPPVIVSGCTPKTVISDEQDCQEFMEHSITATDDCTPVELLKYKWQIDLKNNGSVDQQGNGSFTSGIYPAGKHKITFTVTDLCNNTTTCSYIFHIRDNKPPTPICLGEVTWVIDQNGKAIVWASDFDLKSEDLCDGSDLKFSFNAAGNQPSRTFTCADIPNGVLARIPLKMYVFDSDGNFEFCNVTLILQDSPNTNACANTNNTRILGKISNGLDAGIGNIRVDLDNMNSHTNSYKMSGDDGQFEFEEVTFFDSYTLAPKKNDDLLNGLSTLDLVLIQRHILGQKKLETPHQLICADVNKNKSINIGDLVMLRKALLGTINNFGDNTSYRFLPLSTQFENPEYPYDFNEKVEIPEVQEDVLNNNFAILKIGDVNKSASYFTQSEDAESRTKPIEVTATNVEFNAGQTVELPLTIHLDDDIVGMQFTFEYNMDELELIGFTSNNINLSPDNYEINHNGTASLSWSDVNTKMKKGTPLVKALFTAKKRGDMSSVNISSEQLEAEAYTQDLTTSKLVYRMNEGVSSTKIADSAISTSPNPFSTVTTFQYDVKNAGMVDLRIVDVNGKQVYSKLSDKTPGHYSATITNSDLNDMPGIYYIKLTADGITKSGRIMFVK